MEDVMKKLVGLLAVCLLLVAACGGGGGSSSTSGSGGSGATAPSAPTIKSVTPGFQNAVVAFMAPANDGGSSITSYTVTATAPSGVVVSQATVGGTATSALVTGLTDGTQYAFTVQAENAVGYSLASTSVSATPNLAADGAAGAIAVDASGNQYVVEMYQSGDANMVSFDLNGNKRWEVRALTNSVGYYGVKCGAASVIPGSGNVSTSCADNTQSGGGETGAIRLVTVNATTGAPVSVVAASDRSGSDFGAPISFTSDSSSLYMGWDNGSYQTFWRLDADGHVLSSADNSVYGTLPGIQFPGGVASGGGYVYLVADDFSSGSQVVVVRLNQDLIGPMETTYNDPAGYDLAGGVAFYNGTLYVSIMRNTDGNPLDTQTRLLAFDATGNTTDVTPTGLSGYRAGLGQMTVTAIGGHGVLFGTLNGTGPVVRVDLKTNVMSILPTWSSAYGVYLTVDAANDRMYLTDGHASTVHVYHLNGDQL